MKKQSLKLTMSKFHPVFGVFQFRFNVLSQVVSRYPQKYKKSDDEHLDEPVEVVGNGVGGQEVGVDVGMGVETVVTTSPGVYGVAQYVIRT